MIPERIHLQRIDARPWKNGAGATREIASAGGADFDWRVSVAEVGSDAPFSAFPGIDRCIVLLRGAGMRLRSPDGRIDHALTDALTPFRFAGEAAIGAALVDGPSTDFNVMTRRGAFVSEVDGHRETVSLAGAKTLLLYCNAGRWRVEAGGEHALDEGQALLWRDAERLAIDARPLHVDGANAAAGGGALVSVRLYPTRDR